MSLLDGALQCSRAGLRLLLSHVGFTKEAALRSWMQSLVYTMASRFTRFMLRLYSTTAFLCALALTPTRATIVNCWKTGKERWGYRLRSFAIRYEKRRRRSPRATDVPTRLPFFLCPPPDGIWKLR